MSASFYFLNYVTVPTFERVTGGVEGEQLSRIRPVKMSLTTTNLVMLASILISPIKMEKQSITVINELAGSPALGFCFCFFIFLT